MTQTGKAKPSITLWQYRMGEIRRYRQLYAMIAPFVPA